MVVWLEGIIAGIYNCFCTNKMTNDTIDFIEGLTSCDLLSLREFCHAARSGWLEGTIAGREVVCTV